MAGWAYLPRFIDKIRLSEAGQLHEDYQPNFLHKGFDAKWLEKSGLEADEFVGVVKAAATDGQVCDWIRENVEADDSTRELFNDAVLNYGADETNSELRERLATRKAEAGMGRPPEMSTPAGSSPRGEWGWGDRRQTTGWAAVPLSPGPSSSGSA